mmetsp:Transcript_2140/g.3213  ORF Transcript_2140/g.3213 Transcript_2140/m.3213 type:complete len:80 (+) Transcript_2140:62-301(+)
MSGCLGTKEGRNVSSAISTRRHRLHDETLYLQIQSKAIFGQFIFVLSPWTGNLVHQHHAEGTFSIIDGKVVLLEIRRKW